MALAHDITMPKLGLTMTEGTLSEWHVKKGDRVSAGDVLFVVETDKIANEVEAPADGVIVDIISDTGAVVPVGAIVARWTGPNLGSEPTPSTAPPSPAPSAADLVVSSPPRVVATPLARRLSRQRGIDLRDVSGSGPGGRIKAEDVVAIAEAREDRHRAEPATAIEALIASRVSKSKAEIPHFYVATEAEISALRALRSQINVGLGPHVSVTHFVVAAVGRTLVDQPHANRTWLDGGYLQLDDSDVGLAVQTDRGLVAPVLRRIGQKSLDDVAVAASDLIDRARAGRLKKDDLVGGAITVSNVGMHNVTYLTPIVSLGQSAILGVGSIRVVLRPDDDGTPVARHEIGLVLAADHRVLDGVSGANFLNRIVYYLENPGLLVRAAR